MGKRNLLVAAGVAVTSLLLAACGSSSDSGSSASPTATGTGSPSAATSAAGGGKVGVILPDSASSARYETQDRPLLEAAFKAQGLEFDIQNANGDVTKFQTIADSMIGAGVDVLVIDNLDNESGTAVIKKARAQGIPVIDYDRLTLGGGADFYVSFDNVVVGQKIGEGLVQCLKDANVTSGPVALLNGAPTDNNATLFKQGYEKVIKDAGFTIAADQAVPNWDNTQAGTIFEQMFTKANGEFVGVAAANDGLGGAVISVLARNNQAGKIPVTGQDATVEGLQRVLQGTQCVTVYKAISKEAEATAKLAAALAAGDTAAAQALATGTVTDTVLNTEVKSVLLTPEAIFTANVKDVVADGAVTKAQLCTTAELQKLCAANGIA